MCFLFNVYIIQTTRGRYEYKYLVKWGNVCGSSSKVGACGQCEWLGGKSIYASTTTTTSSMTRLPERNSSSSSSSSLLFPTGSKSAPVVSPGIPWSFPHSPCSFPLHCCFSPAQIYIATLQKLKIILPKKLQELQTILPKTRQESQIILPKTWPELPIMLPWINIERIWKAIVRSLEQKIMDQQIFLLGYKQQSTCYSCKLSQLPTAH